MFKQKTKKSDSKNLVNVSFFGSASLDTDKLFSDQSSYNTLKKRIEEGMSIIKKQKVESTQPQQS